MNSKGEIYDKANLGMGQYVEMPFASNGPFAGLCEGDGPYKQTAHRHDQFRLKWPIGGSNYKSVVRLRLYLYL